MNHNHHHNMAMDTTPMSSIMHHNHHHNMSGGMEPLMNGSHAGGNMTNIGGGMHTGHEGHGGDLGVEGHHMGMGHMMKMYFHTGVSEYVLFESCYTNNDKEMIAACVAIFFVAILYEGLKFMRESLLQRTMLDRSKSYIPDGKLSPGASQETMVQRGPHVSVSKQMLSCGHAIQTFLHVVQIFLSYCLMLVFMTYNVWLCVAVVLGAGVGYFVFGWKRAVIVDAYEHCH